MITEACDWLKPHFGSLVGCNFGPQVVPFCTISDWWCIDIGCPREQASWHTMYWIFVGAGLYKMAMAIDQRPVLGRTRIATISFLIVVVHYAVWQQEVSYCALREVDGATLIPYLYRKAIGAYSGMMWIFQDLLPSEVKVQWLHASMVPRRRLQSGFCIEVLYRVGLANPFSDSTHDQDILPLHNVCIRYSFDIYATEMV